MRERITVVKPWGYERRAFSTERVDGWLMHFANSGDSSSLHLHPQKNKMLIVLQGKAQMLKGDTWEGPFGLWGSQCVEKGTPHRQVALEDDTIILELETPINKQDIVRLDDKYGRTAEPYEDPNA